MRRDVTAVTCGHYATADVYDADKNNQNLEDKDGTFPVGAGGSCNRIGCYDTSYVPNRIGARWELANLCNSAFYVCNDQDVDIAVTYSEAVDLAYLIAGICDPDQSADHWSGQIFTTNLGGYNIVVGYGNCDDPPDTKPSSYGPPNDGVNGMPKFECGVVGGSDCEVDPADVCNPDTLDVTYAQSDSWPSNAFLSAGTVGAGAQFTRSSAKFLTSGWSVGGFLGIDSSDLSKVSAQAGFTGSYSESATTGTTVGTTEQCGEGIGQNGQPGNWTCGMLVTPQFTTVKGTCSSYNPLIGTVAFDTWQPTAIVSIALLLWHAHAMNLLLI